MENVIKVPLFSGASLDVYNPNINYFINKIKKCEYISQIRFQIEYWNMIRSAMRLMGFPGTDMPNIKIDSIFLDELAINMINSFKNDFKVHRGRPWKFSQKVFRNHLSAITSVKSNNFILAISDKGVCYEDKVSKSGRMWQSDLIKSFIPIGEVPFLSTVWRKWAQNGEIQNFIDIIKNKAVIIVGPSYYKNLGFKIGLTNYKYIEISLKEACLHVDRTKRQMISKHSEMIKNNNDVTFLLSGGSAGAYLVYELHNKLKNTHLLELGRAMDVFFCYDDIRKTLPKWVFGQWMEDNPPLWLKK